MSEHNEADRRPPHVAIQEALAQARLEGPEICQWISGAVDDYLGRRCSAKANQLDRCDEGEDDGCPCVVPTGANHRVDLVILIDRSGSMQNAATQVNSVAAAAIEAATRACPADLRVTWLTVDDRRPGTTTVGSPASGWPGTSFNQTHEQYLQGIGVTGPFAHNAPTGGSPYNEQGADAINDVSRYFDWRPRACRAVFYISDTTLDAGFAQDAADVAATDSAISQAQASGVTVFAHMVTPAQTNDVAGTQADYQRLCTQTGGALHVGPVNAGTYRELLTQAICNACVPRCTTVDVIPDLRPCVSISWGDSRCDCLESDDTEVLCITVCNCYSNVGFTNLSIGYVYLTDAAGNAVPLLPDGTPSVQVHPLGPICFGDLPPCRDGRGTCVSREVVLTARGARAGGYRLNVAAICFDVAFHYRTEECFRFELCRD